MYSDNQVTDAQLDNAIKHEIQRLSTKVLIFILT